MPSGAISGMSNYALEIDRYRRLGERAESAGHPELAETARRLAASYEERHEASCADGDVRVLEECQRHNDREIGRLQGLRDALLYREASSAGALQADDARGEIAGYGERIAEHKADNDGIAARLRELRG